jgi:diguanylate cyclase (GGDEF)-like protein
MSHHTGEEEDDGPSFDFGLVIDASLFESFIGRPLIGGGVLRRNDLGSYDLVLGARSFRYSLVNFGGTPKYVGQEVTDLNRRIITLETENLFDCLTGLPNRKAWDLAREKYEGMRKRLDHEDAPAIQICIWSIDIDGLKEINDKFGHDSGDFLIAALASFFLSSIRPNDKFFHLSGDEFALITPEVDPLTAMAIEDRLTSHRPNLSNVLQQAREREERWVARFPAPSPYLLRLPLSFSIGYSFFGSSSASFDEVYHQADDQMYLHKAISKSVRTMTQVRKKILSKFKK